MPDEQLTFSTLEQSLMDSGVPEVPDGLAGLTRKEIKFVTALLRHGQMAQAATDAGYSANSAGPIASETLRKPKVFKFYRACLAQLAANGDAVVQRAMERSTLMHAKACEASQKRADLEELLVLSQRNEYGSEDAKRTTEYETALSRVMKLEKHYMTLANQTDTLLASLLGKLGINVSGEVDHHHSGEVTFGAGTLDALAQVRREVTAAAMNGGRN